MPIEDEMLPVMRGQDGSNQSQRLVFDINSGKPINQSGSDTTITENPWAAWGRKALAGLGAGMTGFAKGFSATWNGQPVDLSDVGTNVASAFGKKTREKQKEVEAQEGHETENKIKPNTQTASVNNPFASYWNNWAENNYKMRG